MSQGSFDAGRLKARLHDLLQHETINFRSIKIARFHASGLRYGVAAIAVGLAVLATVLLESPNGPTLYSLSFIAVMLSAWYGGLGPGILATVFAALSIDYFLLPPLGSIDFTWSHMEQVGIFLLSAVIIGSLTASRRRAEERLAALSRELERKVEERTANLTEAYERLQAENRERTKAEIRAAQSAAELARQNQELLRLQGEMGRVERLAAIGRIAGTIAHDLGTPLNSILGYAQLLQGRDLSADARRCVKIIETQVQRMVSTISQHLSRAGYSVAKGSPVDCNQLIRETLELLRPSFHRQGILVSSELMEALPPGQGDEASLQRVLMNVIDNAVDAMGGGGKLTVASRVSPAAHGEPGFIVVEITDSGAGIAPEVLPRIFEMFVTTKAPGKGTGLGLAVCQQIIKAHGGEIRVHSEVGKGTTVCVSLPLCGPGYRRT
ncbi:MAG: sensor histidine kinase [Alphaproteobacteria bacterium]